MQVSHLFFLLVWFIGCIHPVHAACQKHLLRFYPILSSSCNETYTSYQMGEWPSTDIAVIISANLVKEEKKKKKISSRSWQGILRGFNRSWIPHLRFSAGASEGMKGHHSFSCYNHGCFLLLNCFTVFVMDIFTINFITYVCLQIWTLRLVK